MNVKISGVLLLAALTLAFIPGCKAGEALGPRAWAFVASDGTIMTHGGRAAITVTKVGTGQYCITTSPNILDNFSVMSATLQGPDLSPGFINANTGWGSVCNDYGRYGVFTADTTGAAADRDFGVIIP
jgi:hypothetical protein